MRRRVGVLLMVACGALLLASPQVFAQCPDGTPNVQRVDLSLDYENKGIAVNPESATIYMKVGAEKPGQVCWVVDGLREKYTLHIERKSGQEDRLPYHARRIQSPNDFGKSGRPESAGTWKYKLWVTETGKTTHLIDMDPEIIIVGGGGG